MQKIIAMTEKTMTEKTMRERVWEIMSPVIYSNPLDLGPIEQRCGEFFFLGVLEQLQQLGDQAIEPFVDFLSRAHSDNLRHFMLNLIDGLINDQNKPFAIGLLIQALIEKKDNEAVRDVMLEVLFHMGTPSISPLIDFLIEKKDDQDMTHSVINVLKELEKEGDPVVDLLIKKLTEVIEDRSKANAIMIALINIESEPAQEKLVLALKDAVEKEAIISISNTLSNTLAVILLDIKRSLLGITRLLTLRIEKTNQGKVSRISIIQDESETNLFWRSPLLMEFYVIHP
ncbi:hypothetical protein HN511_05720 [bacterium]|nr:hypothetical protein [bacterium]